MQQHEYDFELQKAFSSKSTVFFVDGPGGTEKTFLYRTLLAAIRSRKLVVLATALFGVVVSILTRGQTTYSRFKISLNLDKNSICNVSK